MRKPRHEKIEIWAPVTPSSGRISVERGGTCLMMLTPAAAASLGARLLKVAGCVEERRRRDRCEREAEKLW